MKAITDPGVPLLVASHNLGLMEIKNETMEGEA
jgi:hypothetical protein